MKTVTQVHPVNEPRLHASLFLWGRRDPPLYRDVTHACENRPTHAPHVTHDPPRCAFNAGWGEAQRTKGYRGKNPPCLPAHRSGPGPTTCRAYVWPRPGGSCRCTKVGALLFYPFTCARTVGAAPTATLSRAEEGSRRHKAIRGNAKTQSKRARWTPPARPLPGQPPRPRQEPCRGNLPDANRASHP